MKNFCISEHKVIFWSKYNILHGRLEDVRTRDYSGNQVMSIVESDFEINQESATKEKKVKKLFKKKDKLKNSMSGGGANKNPNDIQM